MDKCDFQTASKFIADDCIYEFRGGIEVGRDAILKMYRDNADWADHHLDHVGYEHGLGLDMAGRVIATYVDRVSHEGRHHVHLCRQIFTIEDGLLKSICHVDVPGERETLAAFFESCGIKR